MSLLASDNGDDGRRPSMSATTAHLATTTVQVEGMTCGACTSAIECKFPRSVRRERERERCEMKGNPAVWKLTRLDSGFRQPPRNRQLHRQPHHRASSRDARSERHYRRADCRADRGSRLRCKGPVDGSVCRSQGCGTRRTAEGRGQGGYYGRRRGHDVWSLHVRVG